MSIFCSGQIETARGRFFDGHSLGLLPPECHEKEGTKELARVVSNFHGSLLLIWGDFNVILEGGTDLMTLE